MKFHLFFISIVFIYSGLDSHAKEKKSFAWKGMTHTKSFTVKDTVSEEKNNSIIRAVYNGAKLLGFVREIATTTGCNSACLPIKYVSYYNNNGKYLKIDGDQLTKINHTPLSAEDLAQLDIFIETPPEKLLEVDHPLGLTDAITGETLKKFKPFVIKGGAYSTLRIVLYHLETKKHLKSILEKINDKNI